MDTLIFPTVSLLYLLVPGPNESASVRQRVLRFGLPFAITYGAFFTWRALYYGSLLPITGQLKIAGPTDQRID